MPTDSAAPSCCAIARSARPGRERTMFQATTSESAATIQMKS